jgi:hypothetical protein
MRHIGVCISTLIKISSYLFYQIISNKGKQDILLFITINDTLIIIL